MLWYQQHDHTWNLFPCNCNNQSISYFNNFVFVVQKWHNSIKDIKKNNFFHLHEQISGLENFGQFFGQIASLPFYKPPPGFDTIVQKSFYIICYCILIIQNYRVDIKGGGKGRTRKQL